MLNVIRKKLKGSLTMKKLFFFSVLDFMSWETNGLCKKVISQVEAFGRAGCQVDLSYLYGDDICVYTGNEKINIGKMGGLIATDRICKCVSKYIRDKEYDLIYIRYCFSGSGFIRMLKKNCHKVKNIVVEIPTYPYDAEFTDSFEKRLFLLRDRCYRNRMKKYVDRIVTFSKDKVIFGIPTIQTINGIDFRKVSLDCDEISDASISIIAVASMAKWHGYDRLLEGLGLYYRNGGDRNIILHLVGDGPEISCYKEIVNRNEIRDNVIFHGAKSGKELDNLYKMCALAADCFGGHRKGIFMSSSLKSREYVAKGLPIIASTDIDIFSCSNYAYFYKFPETEAPIDIKEIISFYDDVYNNVSRKEVASKIRSYGEQKCDMAVLMKSIIQSI